MRLDLALIRAHPSFSRRKARDVIEKGQVTVDGRLVREPGRDVDGSSSIFFDPHRPALPRARCRLRILYEDEHLLVVDKPAGLLTVMTLIIIVLTIVFINMQTQQERQERQWEG